MRWGLAILAVLLLGFALLRLRVPAAVRTASLLTVPAVEAVTGASNVAVPDSRNIIQVTQSQPSPWRVVLDTAAAQADRRLALHQMVVQGVDARDGLLRVAIAPLPDLKDSDGADSMPAREKKFERALRITAIEALDRMTVTDADLAAPLLATVADRQEDPTLRMLAKMSLSGISEGKPGKLGRFVDKLLKQ